MRTWSQNGVTVAWLNGGLAISRRSGWVLVNAPPGCSELLSELDAWKITAIVLSSGRMRALGGLLEVLGGLSPERTVEVVHPLGAERPPLIVDAWSQGWPGGVPVRVDGVAAGQTIDLAGIAVELVPLRVSERVGEGVQATAGVGVRLELPGATIAWLPSAAPGVAGGRMCAGVDLAVVEVGVGPWPPTDRPCRLDLAGAVRAGSGAAELWLVGDDGSLQDGGPAH